MKIHEVEKMTGITSRNIRFYEKQGLLSPVRSTENKYREFSDEDVRKLKEIKLLRRFGVGLTDIKSIQDGDMTLSECMEMYLRFFTEQKKDLEKTIELCEDIREKESCLQTIDTDFYLDEIASAEEKGTKFVDIAKDFITKARSVLPAYAKLFFEPTEPILNPSDFMKELEKWAEKEKREIIFVKVGMCTTILLDGKRYICVLEMPRVLHFPFSIFFAAKYNFGYRWVYLYEDFSAEW